MREKRNTSSKNQASDMTYLGGSGDTIENAIMINAQSTLAGIAAEYEYISRKHGLEEIEYLHPRLEKLLKETAGTTIHKIGLLSGKDLIPASFMENLQQAAGENVEFLGAVNDEQLHILLAGAKGLIYPVENEDFGIVPLEAISSGKPSLTHVSNGVSEVLPQRFVYSSVKELADKIVGIKERLIKGLSSNEARIPIKIKKLS